MDQASLSIHLLKETKYKLLKANLALTLGFGLTEELQPDSIGLKSFFSFTPLFLTLIYSVCLQTVWVLFQKKSKFEHEPGFILC